MRSAGHLTTLLCLGAALAACQPSPNHHNAPAVPTAKPTVPYSGTDTLNTLVDARIALSKHHKHQAIKQLANAQDRLPAFAEKHPGQSDLLVEITYLSDGTLTKLYIPAMRGEERFAQTKAVLRQLKRASIDPLEYRLVTYHRYVSPTKLMQPLQQALTYLNDPTIEDVTSATIRAGQEIDNLYRQLNIANYEGSIRNRLAFHSRASALFVRHNTFDLARDALKQARAALSDLQLKGTNKAVAESYDEHLNSVEQAIKRKDPSVLTKIGRTINSWVEEVTE